MNTLYKATFLVIVFSAKDVAAQVSNDSTSKTVINLRPVILESAAANSRIGPLYAESIEQAKVSNALDAIVKLRPAMLGHETEACTSQDSLALYINGLRRSHISNTMQSIPIDSSMADDLWAKAGKAIDNGVTGFRSNRKTSTTGKQTNTNWIKTELVSIRSSEIKSIHYVPCDGWSREIGVKNVIWIELK